MLAASAPCRFYALIACGVSRLPSYAPLARNWAQALNVISASAQCNENHQLIKEQRIAHYL
jgi:hypothetical protein